MKQEEKLLINSILFNEEIVSRGIIGHKHQT